jgi:phenylacetic acid degradation operon negative regulatory protein
MFYSWLQLCQADVASRGATIDTVTAGRAGTGRSPAARDRRPGPRATSARSLLLTVLGEFVLPAGEPVWTGTLVAALAGLGTEEKAARQAVARTAAEGYLAAQRDGRRVRWRLTPPGRRLLSEGAARIYTFAEPPPRWDGRWLLVTVTVAASQQHLRHRLRTRMTWAGFGSPAAGLWVSPETGREAEAAQILGELGLDSSALSVTGALGAIGSAHRLVAQAWDLAGVAGRYRAFLDEFGGLAPGPGEPAMLAQIRLVHEWRRFPFLDPRLPAELLPGDWIGRRAGTLFTDRHRAWQAGARQGWRAIAAGPGS